MNTLEQNRRTGNAGAKQLGRIEDCISTNMIL